MGKCTKDKRDIFYRQAKEEGWRARSAFKLLQIDEQFGIFDGVTRAVDLCAAPGSWSQVLSKRLRKSKEQMGTSSSQDDTPIKIVSVDIQTMAPIEGVIMIQGDITSPVTANQVIDEFQGDKAQLVVCDGAPDVTGLHGLDEFMQSQLLLAALNITSFIIEDGGVLVAKIFRGKDITLMLAQLGLFFEQVQVVKPKSSRMSSIEAFLVCRNFALPPNYKSFMFDHLTDLKNNPEIREHIGNEPQTSVKGIIPFLAWGDLNELKIEKD